MRMIGTTIGQYHPRFQALLEEYDTN